jgi:hypothetical protein
MIPNVFSVKSAIPMGLFTIPAAPKQPAEFGNSAAQGRGSG